MTTIRRTFSILAMVAFMGLAINTTDAMARGNDRHSSQHNKQVVHVVERTVAHKYVQAPAPHKTHHKAAPKVQHKVQHIVHHAAPAPLGISIGNNHVSISLPGIHIR